MSFVVTEPDPVNSLECPNVFYIGKYENNSRDGYGCYQWFYNDYAQSYTGQFVKNNLHGKGFYKFEKPGTKFFYDGLFYANKFEGYGQILYENCTHYQGLFKENNRFGPGIFSYKDGSQDVGMWKDDYLVRLTKTIDPDNVPRLAKSRHGKIKLLKYKHLVPVCPSFEDTAYQLLTDLETNEKLLEQTEHFYNHEVRHIHCLFFNKKLFDDNFYTDMDCSIEVPLPEEEYEGEEAVQNEYANMRYTKICDEINLLNEKLEKLERQKKILMNQIETCRICCYPVTPEYEESEEVDEEIQPSFTILNKPKVVEKKDEISLFSYNSQLMHFQKHVTSANNSDEVLPYILSDGDEEYADEEDLLVETLFYKDLCKCTDKETDILTSEETLGKLIKEMEYYMGVKDYLKSRLYIEFDQIKETRKTATKKVIINELLSLNNEPLYMSMLCHTFLNRRSEPNVSFNVCSIISGRPHEYQTGVYESQCIQFLQRCCRGTSRQLMDLYISSNINPDVCDAKGNTGVIFAASKDNIAAIEVLAKLGAKLDYFNDEGLSALNLCLLRYLAIVYEVKSWDEAFLDTVNLNAKEKQDIKNWCPHKSIISLTSFKESEEDVDETNPSLVSKTLEEKPQDYIFRIELTPRLKIENKKAKLGKVKKIPVTDSIELENPALKKLPVLQKTIFKLLFHKANPNACEVPIPTLFLAVFSEAPDLVLELLCSEADPDMIITKNSITCLHTIASLRPCDDNIKICNILLQFTDPNLKVSPEHWPERKTIIIGKGVKHEIEDTGKTALHILCLRQDHHLDTCEFFTKMFKMLNGKSNVVKYLGHNYLSLATLSANVKLVGAILQSRTINPHTVLDFGMGNVMTLFILKRYKDLFPSEVCKEVLDLITNFGGNPLHSVGEFENTIEFMEKEHEEIKDKSKKKGKDKKGKKGKEKSKKSKTSKTKSTKKKKLTTEETNKEYLKELCRTTILKFIQMKLTKAFYDFAEEDVLDNTILKYVAQFVNPDTGLENLKTLFNHKAILQERFEAQTCVKVLEFLEQNQRKEKKKREKKGKGKKSKDKKSKSKSKSSKKSKKSKSSSKSGKTSTVAWEPPKPTFAEMINPDEFLPIKLRKAKFRIKPPGLDNDEMYKVCFNCIRRKNKELYLCPKCELIYFCSEDCNKKGNKLETFHKCKMVYYKKLKKLHDTREESGMFEIEASNLSAMMQESQEKCRQRRVEKARERELEKLEKDRRNIEGDVYGLYNIRRKAKKALNVAISKSLSVMFDDMQQKMMLKKVMSIHKKYSENEIADVGTVFDSGISSKSICGGSGDSDDGIAKHKLEKIKEQSMVTSWSSDSSGDPIVAETIKKKIRSKPASPQKCNPTVCLKMPCIGAVAKKKGIPDLKNYFSQMAKEKRHSMCNSVNIKQAQNFLRRLHRLPEKYQYFVELLAKFFPDLDMSLLFVPYACYSGGQLYYKFLEGDFFEQTYSAM